MSTIADKPLTVKPEWMVGYTNGSVKCNIPKSGGNENIEISESI
jgi:hypothetical protein